MKFKIVLLSSLLFFSCKNRIDEILVSEEARVNTEIAESQREKNDINPFKQGMSGQFQFPTTPNGTVLNPPHGEPGHRCDIAVGAPLPEANTSVVTQYNPITEGNILPQVTMNDLPVQQSVNQNLVNEKGELLNPPHGQPNHRCDIPVGAPLNSKPTSNEVISPQQPTTQVAQQQVVIETPEKATSSGTTAEGFSGKPNPAHGEPGHRCDIAVGAILP